VNDEFYLHEDEWGMVALEPDDNRFERAKVMAEAHAHGEAHRAPGGVGWTEIYVAPAPPVALLERAITLVALRELLGAGWHAATKVSTGYSSYSEAIDTGYALWRERDDGVLYGTTDDSKLVSLNVTHASAALADTLHALGTTFRLILCDLWRDQVVELANAAAVAAYAAGDGDQ
jgi:hypothetical protein